MRFLLLGLLMCYTIRGFTQATIRPELYRDSGKVVCSIYNNVQSKANVRFIDTGALQVEQEGESYIQVEGQRRLFLSSRGAKPITLKSTPGAVSVAICNYTDDSSAYVSIKRGSATVECAGNSWKLQQGDAIRFTDTLQRLNGWKVLRDTTWIEGMYSGEEQPAIVGINAIARRSGYSVVHINAPAGTSTCWTPKPVDIFYLLKMLKETLGFTYKVKGKTIMIKYKRIK